VRVLQALEASPGLFAIGRRGDHHRPPSGRSYDGFETIAEAGCGTRAHAARVGVVQQGGPVGAISITCPTTGKPVSTGMSMEPASFYRSVLTGNSVKCPHCGTTHIWSKSEAIFDDNATGAR
jgi:endogenous inhibitor of DNA gyrase (YacG/DUF329 family)